MSEDMVELLVRKARMRAAKADPERSTSALIAAMAAGAGAELVARQELAREVLATRLRTRREKRA